MRPTIAAAALLVAILLPSACATDPAPRPDVDRKMTRVKLETWKQTVDVDLMGRTLSRSLTEFTYANRTSGTPSSASTISEPPVALEAAKIEEVRALVLGSGFLDLEAVYGAPEGERYYPHRITVSFDGGDQKDVLFRSDGDHQGKPEAFATLEAYLLGLTASD